MATGARSHAPTARSATTVQARRHFAPPAYTPGSTPRKEAKVLDAGARVEAELIDLITSKGVGVDAWRRPGVRVRRSNGTNYVPDAAGFLPELEKLCVERIADVIDERPHYNVLFEFKSQNTTGSASQKIPTAIVDLAEASDVLGVAAALILSAPALTRQEIESFKTLGATHSVVVLEDTDLTSETLRSELIRVASERKRMMNRIGPRGGFTPTKKNPLCEKGLGLRVAMRRRGNQPLYRYGLADL